MMIRLFTLILLVSMLSACDSSDDATLDPLDSVTEEATEAVEISEGERIFTTFYDDAGFSCLTCHAVDSDTRRLGPGLLSIEARFETYSIEVVDLDTYIREAIVDPAAFIVPSESPYPVNIMPRNYAEILTEQEIDDLVDYILSQ